jgi:cytochrome c553
MKPALLRWLVRLTLLLMVLAIAGGLAMVSGVVPIKASSRHWQVTAWLLDFGKRRSVSTHTLGRSAPTLAEPWLVLKGAGQYESACRPCHGAPDLRNPMVPAQMTPFPPALGPRIARWEPEELMYIVKHGIKFTGMPAWPSQVRDDEVEAMVAFLLELPKLDAAAYRRLVDGETNTAQTVLEPLRDLPEPAPVPPLVLGSCARCHGLFGEGRGSAAFPKLAGQTPEYLTEALHAFARGKRHSGIMQPIAAALTPGQRQELSRYYSRLTRSMAALEPNEDSAANAQARARGQRIAEAGILSRGVPACRECHGPATEPRNPHYPKLEGQYADYLVLQLRLFKSQDRGGSPYAHLMTQIASLLNETEIRDVAHYYAALRESVARPER